jgi:ribosomal protein S18 acetylase RimI-like enzyme
MAYGVEAALIGSDAIPALNERVTDVQHVIGVLVDGRIVAFVGYRRSERTVDIDRLVVEPSSFRRGYARTLLEYVHHVEDDADFEVSTASANWPAVQLYLSLGYQQQGEIFKSGLAIARFKRTFGEGDTGTSP